MNPHEINALHILHVFSVIGLAASVFYACASGPEKRKRVAMWGGLASLVALLTGIRMWQGMYDFRGGWAIAKIVCWFLLSGLSGMAYRKREHATLWIVLALLLVAIALVMVYIQPF
jgi:hypothetical protein